MKIIKWLIFVILSVVISYGQTLTEKTEVSKLSFFDDMYLVGIENMDDDSALESVCIVEAPIDPIIHIFDGEDGELQWTSTEWKTIKMFVRKMDSPNPLTSISLKDIDNDGKAELIFLGKKKTEPKARLHILEF